MTRLIRVDPTCSKCGHSWTTIFHASICTWLNPEMVEDLYQKGAWMTCPDCQSTFQVHATILINAPTGMFWLDTGQGLEDIRRTLQKEGVVDEEGHVVSLRRQGGAGSNPFLDQMYI